MISFSVKRNSFILAIFVSSIFGSNATADVIEKSCLSNPSSAGGIARYNSSELTSTERNEVWTKAVTQATCASTADIACPTGTIDLGFIRRVSLQDSTAGCTTNSWNQSGNLCTSNPSGYGYAVCYACTVSVNLVKACALPGT